jgi:hypothetical protein
MDGARDGGVREATPADSEHDDVRRDAVERIKRRRHFHVELVGAAIGVLVLVVIWGASEYHNAGGWPTHGFSQSSGIHDVWNFWIIYPVIAVALVLGVRAWSVYGRRAISEEEIDREIERQGGRC